MAEIDDAEVTIRDGGMSATVVLPYIPVTDQNAKGKWRTRLPARFASDH